MPRTKNTRKAVQAKKRAKQSQTVKPVCTSAPTPPAKLYYFEKVSFDGTYSPCTSDTEPTLKKGQGGRPSIRAVKLVNRGHHRLTLDDLKNCYGQDGKFTAGSERGL